jgi:two-component system cell cycle response regulator
MAASDRPPAPQRASDHPKTSGSAVLEPPPRPPALSAEQDPPGNDAILVVIYTKNAHLLGRRFVLDQSPVLVGRDAENDIVLRDASVSPRHAHLEAREATWWCVDDGSADGLYIDDRLTIGGARLAHGARIAIGSTVFKFLCGSELEAKYHEEIYQITVSDGLTQVHRERYLVEMLDKEILRARRRGSALALLMIEVDELGAIGGSNGPPNMGDHVLREVAGLLRHCVPRDGLLARRGDAAFVIVLPECTLESARAVAESVCEKVASSRLAVGPGGLRATVCIGGVQRGAEDRASGDILERASRALHVARSRGRNQLECRAVDECPNSGPGG